MAKQKTSPAAETETAAPSVAGIDPDARYAVQVTGRLEFERAKLAPAWSTEVTGDWLIRLLASPHRDKVAGVVKV
ncbi:hypothetical protein [Rhodoplanes sp. SY1]|uniref:hypothetical protein n=1 Tax=Rhodoplanes sp. SY1 TaxID=3166646 RepID=UPI0038B602EE